MEKKESLPRDGAGRIELKGGTGPVIGMYPAGDFMEVYKIDRTFRVHTPEVLDPERKDPNMSFAVTLNEEVGSGNLIVSRVFIQAAEAIKAAPLRNEINKEQIVILCHSAKELLLACEKAKLEFDQKIEGCKKQIEEGLKKEGNVVSPFPVVHNLDSITTAFLINAKRFIETEAKVVNEFFQTTFDGPRFNLISAWAKKKFEKNQFTEFLEAINANLKFVIDLRNFQEHPKPDKRTNINNFRLLPHKKIAAPTWNVTGNPETHISDDMQGIIYFLIEFSEILFFNCLMLNLATPFPHRVKELDKANRNMSCPMRFLLEIDQEEFFKRTEANRRDGANSDGKQ